LLASKKNIEELTKETELLEKNIEYQQIKERDITTGNVKVEDVDSLKKNIDEIEAQITSKGTTITDKENALQNLVDDLSTSKKKLIKLEDDMKSKGKNVDKVALVQLEQEVNTFRKKYRIKRKNY